MTKASIEELWVRQTAECAASPEMLDVSLVVLLNGWNVNDAATQGHVSAKWREVHNRWCRELGEMSACAINIEMQKLGDDRSLDELSRLGTRLFVAL